MISSCFGLRNHSMKNSLSIVIPVYRSAEILSELYGRLKDTLVSIGVSFEIIFVDDSSPDVAWQVIQELASCDARVRGIKLTRNYGQHNALLCGIRAARNEVIVTMDDDLQHPPDEIPVLLDKLEEGHAVVY